MIERLFRISFLFVVFMIIAGISAYLTLAFFLKTSDEMIVPDLRGKHVVSALEQLTNLSLNIKLSGSEFNDDIPRHYVLRQEPEAGAKVKKGRDIRLVLSNGSLMLFAPDVRGRSLQQARIMLEEKGLCFGNVAVTYSSRIGNDVVMAQFPGAGMEIKRDQCIQILVSGGARPQAYAMPDLRRKLIEDAILSLDSCRLRLGKITKINDMSYQPDEIIRQEPPPGHRVLENDFVDLVINRPSEETETAIPTTGQWRLFSYRLDNGFLNRHVKVQLSAFGTALDLYDNFLKPGEEIWFVIPNARGTSLHLFCDDEPVITDGSAKFSALAPVSRATR